MSQPLDKVDKVVDKARSNQSTSGGSKSNHWLLSVNVTTVPPPTVDVRDAASWKAYRPALAKFVRAVVAGVEANEQVRRFIESCEAQREFFDVLERDLADANEFTAFVEQTAVDGDWNAYVLFAARFPLPLHVVAHRAFLAPLAHRWLGMLARATSVGLAPEYMLPFDLIAQIEALQQQRRPKYL